MALTNAYGTLAQLKSAIRIAASDTDSDARLEDAGNGAARAIDEWTHRRFYAETLTRYFTPRASACLDVPDLLSITTLKTDEDGDRTFEITWDADRDYYLAPYDAANLDRPFWRIEVDRTNGLYCFPLRQRSVEVIGSWGYCATGSHPEAIREAWVRLAIRLYKLPDAPLGVAGNAETGLIRIGGDRDLQRLLEPYTLVAGVA